jgi:hypothetical protein
MTASTLRSESGFSLIELLVATFVTLVVLAGTSQILQKAIEGEAAVTQVLDMNGHLRAAMDLIQRDLLQAGQGLPVGRRIGIPNGGGITPITRPGPGAQGACAGVDLMPAVPTLPAVMVGPDLGPEINDLCTDVITILAADNLFGKVAVTAIAADGLSATIADPPINNNHPRGADISDDPDVDSDNLRPGDLLMFEKGIMSVLVQVTEVNGQEVRFDPGAGDLLGINQMDADTGDDSVAGTLIDFREAAPADPGVPTFMPAPNNTIRISRSNATRIRMVSYFVDTTAAVPRLMRQIGGTPANAVAIGVESFRISYDIANQATNPTSVRMDAEDLAGNGACPDDPATVDEIEACSENQIRKVNVVLSMRAAQIDESRLLQGGTSAQSTLYAQVSLRSLAFVDRYQ